MANKLFAVKVLSLNRHPLKSLTLVKPKVSIKMREEKQEIWESCTSGVDSIHGDTLNFHTSKKLKFSGCEVSDQTMLVVVSDIDPLGSERVIASGEIGLPSAQPRWYPLHLQAELLASQHHIRPDSGVEATASLFIKLCAQMEAASEKDIFKLSRSAGVEEEKEQQYDSEDEKEEEEQESATLLGPEDQPNMLKVTIHKATNLHNDGKPPADVFIKMKFGKKNFGKSPAVTVTKVGSPQIGWCYYLDLNSNESSNQNVKIEVCEHREKVFGIKSEEVIGHVTISSEELARYMQNRETVRQTYTLTAEKKSGKGDPYTGDLHLRFEALHICEGQIEEDFLASGGYDSEVDSCTSDVGSDCESSDEEGDAEEDGQTMEEKQKEKEEAREQAKKEREEMDKMLEMMENTEVKSGRYEVKVHVIGVRGLKIEDHDGVPSPMVQVSVWDQKKSTTIKNPSTEATFDTMFFFELEDMIEDTLRLGRIRCSVFDANSYFGKGSLVGAWQTDFDYIYYKPDHEFYRKWVPLSGGEAGGDEGVTGYLQVSITILGPGDKAKHHNRKKEIEDEMKLKQKNPNHFAVDIPKTIQQLKFLVATFHKAENLPVMDNNLLDGCGIDAYCQIQCGDLKSQRTKVKNIKAKNKSDCLDAVFKEQIWLPFYSPTMSNRVIISVWDKEKIGQEIVATADILHLDMIDQFPKNFESVWLNLYGAPLEALPPMSDGRRNEMNQAPSTASTYRGRILMTLRIDDNKPKTIMRKGKKMTSKPKKAKPLHISKAKEPIPFPQKQTYAFRLKALLGSELPTENFKTEFCIQMSCGPYHVRTVTKEAENGVCFFEGETLECSSAIFPADLTMVPDVILYLIRNPGNTKPGFAEEAISFKRFRAKELFEKGFSDSNKWIDLTEDYVLDAVKKGTHPGSLLVKIGFGLDHTAESTPWEQEQIEAKQKFQARIHVYQARNLPAADDSGLIDPFVKVFFGGKQVKNKMKRQTKNPAYYETLVIDDLVLTDDRDMMPMFNVQVWDWDLAEDDFIGSVRVPAYDDIVDYHTQTGPGLYNLWEGARWYQLGREKVGDVQGELLLGFELIKIEDLEQPMPPIALLKPNSRDYLLQLIPLGCRDLQGGWLGLQKPFVEFCINDEVIYATDPSRDPRPDQPNFLPAIKKDVHIQLPKDPIFAPVLTINVRDSMFGGFQKPLIGSAYVSLESRIKFDGQGNLNEHYSPNGDPHLFTTNPYLDLEAEQSKHDLAKDLNRKNSAASTQMMQHRSVDAETMDANKKNEKEVKPLKLGSAFELNDDEMQTMIPDYMIGRDEWNDSWEERAGLNCPFERFPLYTGRSDFDGKGGSERKCVGIFKGIIRLMSDKEQKSSKQIDPPIIKELQREEAFQVRLYVLKGRDLTPKDTATNKADPYLKVSLGNTTYGDRKIFHTGTLSPDFYQRFDFVTRLPGVSQIHLEVFDKDLIFDELIGKTVIDLEDRWFNAQWRETGLDPVTRKPKRPVETRTLWSPISTNPQGNITCWLDITMQKNARDDRPIVIAPEPNTEFEMRVVVWKVQNVPYGDPETEMSDMFIKCDFGIIPAQQTDVHWRATEGKGSFNWRMKFPLRLPITEEGGTWFKIGAWDKDLIDSDDCLCEASFDLSIPLKKAFLHRDALQLFKSQAQIEELKQLEKEKRRLEMIEKAKHPLQVKQRGGEDLSPLLEPGDDAELGAPSNGIQVNRHHKKKQPSMWNQFKEQLGVGPDPDYSTWLPLKMVGPRERLDGDPEVLISIEVLPKTKADLLPAGLGRDEPNQNPALPPPTGRIDFTRMFNPFYCIQSLIGSKNAHKLYCACCLVLFLVLAFTVGPFLYESYAMMAVAGKYAAIGIFCTLAAIVCVGCFKAQKDLSSFCGVRHPCDCCSRRDIIMDDVDDLDTEELEMV